MYKSKRQKISLIIIIGILILSTLVTVADYGITENQLLNLDSIKATLKEFDFQQSYDGLVRLYEQKGTYSSIEQLEILHYLIKLERRYGKLSDMLLHAITLYEQSVSMGNNEYIVTAIDAMAYYDYYYYDNESMLEKNDQLLYFLNTKEDVSPLYYYYTNLAYYQIDLVDYSEALELLEKASIEAEGLNYLDGFSFQIPVLIEKAYVYELLKGYEKSTFHIREALDVVDIKDLEMQTLLNYKLAYYLYKLNNYEDARKYIDKAIELYDSQNELFKNTLYPSTIYFVKADIEYSTGFFEEAAHFYNLMHLNPDPDPENVQKAVEARTAVSEFRLSEITEKLTLLEQLEIEQQLRLQNQERALEISWLLVVFLIMAIAASFFVIRVQVKQKKLIHELSITDPLTHLFNRRYIIDAFEKIKKPVKCIALLDLDFFKLINDTYGHLVGDEVLRRVSVQMRQSIRQQDQIGRYGGEEFLLIIDTDDKVIALQVIERVRLNIETLEFDIPGLKVTASIGVVMSRQHSGDLLLSEADNLLYRAKKDGRNQIAFKEL